MRPHNYILFLGRDEEHFTLTTYASYCDAFWVARGSCCKNTAIIDCQGNVEVIKLKGEVIAHV